MRFAPFALPLLLVACQGATPRGEQPSPVAGAPDDAGAAAPESAPRASEVGRAAAPAPEAPPAPQAAPGQVAPPADPAPLPAGLKVLVIGDSFAQALGVGLKSKEQATGIKLSLRGEQATFIPEWAGPTRGVAAMVKQLSPDLVVIALGGNELAMTTPEIRAPKVRKLVGLLEGTPCVWVSPPLWDIRDNGLLGVIRDNSTPCRHFDSNALVPGLPRGADKIHPTADGQKQWAEAFLTWLRKERDPAAPSFALRPRPNGE